MPHGLTPDELRFLAASDDFQKIIASDPELDRLEAEKYDEDAEFLLLIETLQLAPLAIGGVPVASVTPAIWSLLWALKSPYARGGTVRGIDVDLFFFLLARSVDENGLRNLECTISEIPAKAAGFCENFGLAYETIDAELRAMVRTAFLPLGMLPPDRTETADSGSARFDADWLTRIVSIAAREANEPAHYVMHRMSLSACCAYYVNSRRAADVDRQIRRREAPELAGEIMDRAYELGRAFIKTHPVKTENQ